MAAHDEVIPEPMSIERREAKSPLRAEPLPSPSVPDVQVPNYRTEWGRSRATETARGQTALMTAMQEALETKIALTRTRAKEEDLPRILATDQCKREGELVGGLHKLVAVRSLLDLEKARAETALLEEKGKQVKIEIQIAQDKKTLERLRNSPPPLSEEEERREAVRRKIRERLSDRHTEAEIRGEERILREKILSCTNGVVTPEVQRGLDNLRDAVQGLIDEL